VIEEVKEEVIEEVQEEKVEYPIVEE